MANELLKFRKGLYANLPTEKSAGTIYVTTDEQAMYVDIDASTRIRLGETVHFSTLTDFQEFLNGTKPPYNSQAFYYIDSENALLKWVSSGGTYNPDVDGDGTGDSNGTWKQINSTAALTTEINDIKNRLSAIETEQTTQNNSIKANTDAITRIDGEIGETDGSTEGSLWEAIKANQAAIESNDTDIENLQTNKVDVTTFNTYKTEVAESIKAVDDKLGSSTDTSNTSTAFQRIEALEQSNETKASQADVNALKTTVYGGTDLTQDTAADGSLVKKVANLEDNKANASDLNALSKVVDGHTTNITELTTNLGEPTAAAGTDSAFARIKQLEEAVGDGTGESLSGRLEAVEKTLNGDESTGDQGLVKDVEDIQTALGSKDDASSVDSVYGNLAALEEKNSEQDNNIVGLNYAINGNPNGTTEADKAGLAGRLTSVETQVSDIETEIGEKADTVTGDTLWDAIKASQEASAANKTLIGDANSGLTKQVNTNTSDISAIKTDVASINTEIGDATDPAEGTLWYAIKTNAADIDKLEQTIADEINAANGMTYKGGVADADDVNALTDVEIGDTYVATNYFEFTQDGETKQIYAGDLLVASGTELDGVIVSDLKWTIVNTGYIESHEATLGVAALDNGAQINLNSYVSTLGGNTPNTGDLGKVKITSDNLIITSSYDEATKTSEIKINAVWGDFDTTAT